MDCLVGIEHGVSGRPNLPPRPVLSPHRRHRLLAVTQQTLARAVNSVIEPTVDGTEDIAAINRGEALQQGDTYTVHGRTCRVEETGRAYPVAGPGIQQLRRGSFKALGIYNQFGPTEGAETILDRMRIDVAKRTVARDAWRAGRPGTE